MLKKWILVCISLLAASSIASANSSCGLLKFTDDTRFEKIGSADVLSELVMEKMLASGRFSMREMRPIGTDAEEHLYGGKVAEKKHAEAALQTGNYDALFEGEGFSEKRAATIGSAQKGQLVYPEIMRAIGKENGVDYIIQGTVVDFGKGQLINDDAGGVAFLVKGVANLAGAGGVASVADIFSGSTNEKQVLGVVAALRVIRADTGEVIWCKKVTGQGDVKKFSTGDKKIQTGSDRLYSAVYSSAMDNVAKAAVDAMIADMDSKELLMP